MRYLLTSVRTVVIKKTKGKKQKQKQKQNGWSGCREEPHTLLVGMLITADIMENSMRFLKKKASF
jgi:hypothetical protein